MLLARRSCLRLAVLASLLLALVPALWPALDLAVARLFWTQDTAFTWARNPVVQAIYWGTSYAARLLVVVFVVAWVHALLRMRLVGARDRTARRQRRAAAFLLLSLALGPGLLVNATIKEWSGRARPDQVEAFGGPRTFTPAPWPADQCRSNCSFVSGHAALGFWLVAPGLLVARPRRRGWLLGGIAAGLLIGGVRIAMGGHWLSDILWGFAPTMAGIALAWLITHRPRLLWRLATAPARTPAPISRRTPE